MPQVWRLSPVCIGGKAIKKEKAWLTYMDEARDLVMHRYKSVRSDTVKSSPIFYASPSLTASELKSLILRAPFSYLNNTEN